MKTWETAHNYADNTSTFTKVHNDDAALLYDTIQDTEGIVFFSCLCFPSTARSLCYGDQGLGSRDELL